MLSYTLTFLIASVITGFLGFLVIGGLVGEIAKILCGVFFILCVISFVASRHPPL